MVTSFPQANGYLFKLDIETADPLDQTAFDLISDEAAYERASQALRRRFARGAEKVEAIDRAGRSTWIKRELNGTNKYKYFVEGSNGEWFEPEERIWVVAMYALWQKRK